MKVVVDLDRRSPATGADTLDLFQREDTIRGRLFVADTQLVFAVVENLVPAAQHAGDIRAHLHVVLACRFCAQHRVVRKHVANVQLEKVDALCDLGNHGVGDVSHLILCVQQHGNERRPLERVYGNEFVEA